MEFSRFSLGLRFAMTPHADLTPEKVFSLLFSRVSPESVAGLTLYCMQDDTAKDEPEPAFVCVFSNASLRRAKKLFSSLQDDTLLCSYLTAFQPFVQNNLVEKCGTVRFVGKVEADGTVTGGDVAYDKMCFSGAERAERSELVARPRFLIAPESLSSGVPSADVARSLARSVARAFPDARILPLRIADGGKGTIDTLVAACHGRYLMLEQAELRCGVLPDRVVVLETEGIDAAAQSAAVQEICDKGYKKILLAAGRGPLPDALPPDVAVQVLNNLPKEKRMDSDGVTYRSGIESVLEYSGFLRHLNDAACMITCTDAPDASCRILDSTVDTILFHCRNKEIPTVVLAVGPDGGYGCRMGDAPAFPLSSKSLDAAADEIAGKLIETLLPFKK